MSAWLSFTPPDQSIRYRPDAYQFAVASELCKRGYEVSFTMGNTTPVADLMVVSPKSRQMFLVDVKGLYRTNPWQVKRKDLCSNLFYVFAYVPTGKPNRFFIMAQDLVNQTVVDELVRLERPDDYAFQGFNWALALPHEDAWHRLPV
jgi:hypothetical protein